jgi:hypothetical protein
MNSLEQKPAEVRLHINELTKEGSMTRRQNPYRFIAPLITLLLSGCMEFRVRTPEVMIDPNITPPAIIVYVTDEYCPSLETQVGWTVMWINDGKEAHILRSEPSPEGNFIFNVPELQPGDGHSVQFSEPGLIQYQCSEDGSLTGTITVHP